MSSHALEETRREICIGQLSPLSITLVAGSICSCSPLPHTRLVSQVQTLLTSSDSRLGRSTLTAEVPGFSDGFANSTLPTSASTKGELVSDFSLILQLLLFP